MCIKYDCWTLLSNFPQDKFIITPYEEQFEPIEYGPNRFRNNASMVAMSEAIKRGFDVLDVIGCDFMIEDKNLNMGNVYENTNAYGPETRASYYDTLSRCRFMDWYASQNQHILFQFVFPRENNFRVLNSSNVVIKVHDPKLHF